MSVTVKNKAAQDWVDGFMKVNKLNGSKLVDMVELLEKEGKNLLLMRREGTGDNMPIRFKLHPWTEINYKVETDKYDDPVKVELLDADESGKNTVYNQDQFVYINTGGCLNDINDLQPRTARLLTRDR